MCDCRVEESCEYILLGCGDYYYVNLALTVKAVEILNLVRECEFGCLECVGGIVLLTELKEVFKVSMSPSGFFFEGNEISVTERDDEGNSL